MISVMKAKVEMSRGNWGWRQELDGLLYLDTKFLKDTGYLSGHWSGTIHWDNNHGEGSSIGVEIDVKDDYGFTKVKYTTVANSYDEARLEYYIHMVASPCNLGGQRWWFDCPLVRSGSPCGNRVRKLFKNGKYFGCRQCLRLCYASQNENRRYRTGFFKIISDSSKAEQFRASFTREYYNGRPTRKMQRYRRLEQDADSVFAAWSSLSIDSRRTGKV